MADPKLDGLPIHPCAMGVMAKVPVAGAVKTRLSPALRPDQAARLAACFLRDTTENIATVNGVDGVVLFTPARARASLNGLLPDGFRLLAQRGETLGERLVNAAEDLFQLGYASICLIDSDSPTLPHEILVNAMSSLAREGDRLILGPAEDGGYYLIGLKHPHSALFERIAWSTADVLAHTLERAAEIKLPAELLPAWYDVDDLATLQLLCNELGLRANPHEAPRSLSCDRPAPEKYQNGYRAVHTHNYLVNLIAESGHEPIFPLGERSSANS